MASFPACSTLLQVVGARTQRSVDSMSRCCHIGALELSQSAGRTENQGDIPQRLTGVTINCHTEAIFVFHSVFIFSIIISQNEGIFGHFQTIMGVENHT